jgi:general secretion pathway protein L
MAAGSTLVLDITADMVAGVAVQESKQGGELLSTHYHGLDESLTLEGAIAQIVEQCPAAPQRCLVSIGAEQLHYRLLHVPFSDLKKVRSVIPFEIEDSAFYQDRSPVYDYLLQPSGGGTDVFAVLADRLYLQELLEILGTHGLDPELITLSGLAEVWNKIDGPDPPGATFALVQVGWKKATVFIVIDNELKAVRSISVPLAGASTPAGAASAGLDGQQWSPALRDTLKSLAADINHSLIAAQSMRSENEPIPVAIGGAAGSVAELKTFLLEQLGARPAELQDEPYFTLKGETVPTEQPAAGYLANALALAACRPRDRERINLRTHEFAFAGWQGRYTALFKYAAWGLAGVAAAVIIYQAVRYQNMASQRQELAAQIESIYRQTVPASEPGPEPLKQLQVKVRELGGVSDTGTLKDPSITAVRLLGDISSRLPASMDISFDRLIYDRKSIRIRGVTDNFNTVEQMKNRLAQSPFFAEVAIGSANADPKVGGVRFELKLQL